jgi:uncharacterized protein (TIRG00374 family)
MTTIFPKPWPPRKIRLARYLLPLLIMGLAIHLLLPQIASLENSISIVRSMSPWLVGLAALAQICSYLGSGYLLKVIVDLGQSRLSIVRGALITLAATSIGLVAGGWVGAAAATYRWVEKSEDVSEEAALAGVLPLLFNNALLVIVTVIGLVYLLIKHNLSRPQVIGYALFLSVLGIGIVAVVYAIQHPEVVMPQVLGIIDRLMKLLRRAYDPSGSRDALENIYVGLALLRKSGWGRPALGSAINIGFDMLTLYLLFIAAGHTANPGVLMAGYGIAFLLGKAAFLFPGGVGVIESGMAAIYTNLGIPSSISVVVILSYRLFSFWIPSLLGFALIGYLQRTPAKSHSPNKVIGQ